MADPVEASDTAVDNADVAYLFTQTSLDAFRKLAIAKLANSVAPVSAGQMFYIDGSGNVVKLDPEDNGNVLSIAGGIPAWSGDIAIAPGLLAVAGTASTGSVIGLFEDTDNGLNFVALKAPDAIGASITFTLPSADGNPGDALVTDGSGNLSFGSSGISAATARRITQKYSLIV